MPTHENHTNFETEVYLSVVCSATGCVLDEWFVFVGQVGVVLAKDPVPTAPVLLGLVSPDGVRPSLVVVPLHRASADDRTAQTGGKATVRSGKTDLHQE